MQVSKIGISLKKFSPVIIPKKFFRNILFLVFVFVIGYSILFLAMGAILASLQLLGVAVVFSPLAIYFEKINKPISARFVFITMSLMAIYCSHLGFRKDIYVEFYYIPAIMLSILLFEPTQKLEILVGWIMPLVAWVATRWGPRPNLPDSWFATNVPVELFRTINFFGAFVLSALFLWLYAGYLLSLRQIVIHELENSKSMELQLEAAQRMAKIGNWEFDLKTRTIRWSKELYRIYELTDQDPLTLYQSFRQMFHKEDIHLLDTAVKKSLSTGEGYEIEYRIILKNGGVKVLLGRGEVLKNENGEAISLFGTAQDITESRQIAEALYNQQLKLTTSAKMASLGEMAGGIAHEINNPLAIIQGKALLVIAKLENPELDTESVKADVERIVSTIGRIAKIIKGLKSFSRNADKDPMVETKIQQTIEEVLDFCRERFKNKRVDLQVDVPQIDPINCRSTQIGQVLLNLINNSFDAVQTLEKKWVRIQVLDFQSQIEIRITDSGTGIPADVVDRMMQPFFTTKELGQGTGLGLSISLGIIQDHKGKLFDDETSPNTCFRVVLPREQNESLVKVA